MVDLAAGLAPLLVTYARPEEAMPWLHVRVSGNGTAEVSLASPLVVQAGVTPEAAARDAWLRPLALAVDAALLAVLAAGFVAHLMAVARRPLRQGLSLAERAFLAVYLVVGAGRELLAHLHLHDRAVLLSGGNDWLAYESYARDVLLERAAA